ncbi:MAG: conjugal transfer protein TraF [Deltaproteobacteria bacterium]|nr:conjugal transfer protein TraF [Deltaproteobacteria bacterium]
MSRIPLFKVFVFTVILLLALSVFSFADSDNEPGKNKTESKKTYSEGNKDGWWWYKKEKVKPEEKKPAEKEVTKHRIPNLDNYTLDKLWDMHPDDFQALLMDFQKEAVRDPTEQNVRDYYVMQDIARRKALAFTHVAGYVMQKYPRLNVASAAPLNAPGRNASVKARHEDTVKILRDNKNDFALLYFTAPGCKYCDAQDDILIYFVQRAGWTVKGIDVHERPDLAERFGIQVTPSITLIYRNSGDFFPVSAGVMDVATLELNLARGIQYLKGEMTPEQYGIHEHQKGGIFDPKSILESSRH